MPGGLEKFSVDFGFQKNKNGVMQKEPNNHVPLKIPNRVVILCNRWQNLHRFWWSCHYVAGLTSVATGALAAANTLSPLWLWGVVAAFAASVVTFLRPLQKAKQYQLAFHLTDHACLEYEIEKIDLSTLVDKVEEARLISVDMGKALSAKSKK